MGTNRWLEIVDRVGPGFAEGAAERDATDEFVAPHYEVLRESGLLSALVPEDLGGGGASYEEMADVLRQFGYWDGPTALALSMHQHLVAAQVVNRNLGRPTPILSRVAAEQIVLVSTGASDWLESNGELTRVEGGYRLTARKAFASGSPAGSVVMTSAPYDDPEDGWSVLHFGVPLSAEGVSLDDDWYVHGMRATGSRTIVMKDVFIPEGSIALKRPRSGYPPVYMIVATVALPLIAAVYVGIAERAAELAKKIAARRAAEPVVQWAAGEMMSALEVARACHARAVANANGLDFTPDMERTNLGLVLKTATVENALKVVESAMEAAGGAGLYRVNGLERLLRDVRAGHYHPLPAKQQMEFSGRMALGLEPV